MLFDVTKYHLRGSLKDKETVEEMTFSSLRAAEDWAEKASLHRLSTYLVIDITQKSGYISY